MSSGFTAMAASVSTFPFIVLSLSLPSSLIGGGRNLWAVFVDVSGLTARAFFGANS
jgi:hypothetical protein